MTTAPGRRNDERGETLVEILVAVVILGLTGVAVLVGMGLSIKASAIQRKETTGGAQVRTYAEDIQSYITANPSMYTGCPVAGAYSASTVGFAKPTDFNTPSYTVSSISQNSSGQVIGVACGSDVGLQLLTLSLQSTDGRATEKLTFVLRRPCDTNAGSACP